jgi:hypothetical protein
MRARTRFPASVFPEAVEPRTRQFRITDGVLNVSVAEIVLQRASVLPIVRELEAASMAQHVRMNRESRESLFGGEEAAGQGHLSRKGGGAAEIQ